MAEREAKLVIIGERPATVADAIAGLEHLAGRPLVSAGAVVIRDVYFDTPAGALVARRDSLRIRIADGEPLLTLKGPSREVDPGVVERDELEIPWSEPAYARLLELLAERGIALRRAPRGHDPLSTLLASGLARIQERETSRRRRHVDGAGPPIAELALDEVTYHLDAGSVRHHEVEIEAKAPEGAPYLPRAVSELLARFGPALTPWRHGKLATGLAIERALAAGDAGDLLAGGHLTPAAYLRLAAILSGAPAPPGD